MLVPMRIGELARRTGTTTKTIRYYEEIGLLPAPDRASNDYRDYSEAAVDRLKFVRDAQATGLTLTEIGSILDLAQRRGSDLPARRRPPASIIWSRSTITSPPFAGLAGSSSISPTRARSLDPADCVDPNRCQTISHGYAADADTVPRRSHRALRTLRPPPLDPKRAPPERIAVGASDSAARAGTRVPAVRRFPLTFHSDGRCRLIESGAIGRGRH